MLFRKTLLALSIAAPALPISAQTVQLTDAGFLSERQVHDDDLTITGKYSVPDEIAVQFLGSTAKKDLILDATIQATGNYATGALIEWSHVEWNDWETPSIDGNLINRGNISAAGDASSALAATFGRIGGNLVNQGTLSAKGDTISRDDLYDSVEVVTSSALYLGSWVAIAGDVINTANGKILAEGRHASGITLEAADVNGKLINAGLIQVKGDGSAGINATRARSWYSDGTPAFTGSHLQSLENQGTIIAEGEGANAIRLDGTRFDWQPTHVLNSGTIQSSDTGISILRAQRSWPYWVRLPGPHIVNSGTIIAGKNAIDASGAQYFVNLTMLDGSRITGNLLGLYGILVSGNTEFTGTSNASDQTNIEAFRLQIGSVAGNIPSNLNLLGSHTRLDGNLYVAGNSSLGLNLYSTTKTDTPLLNVDGSATFESGAKITLAAQGKDFDVNGSTYTLVKADYLRADAGIDLSSSSALLKIDSYELADNRLVATVTGKSNNEISLLIGRNGGSLNGQRTVSALNNDSVIKRIREQNPNDPLLQTLLNTNEADLTRIAEQLAPETNGGATQAATTSQNLISTATGNRTSGLRGASSGDAFKEAGVWVQSLYSDATQDLRDGVAGYNAYSRGIAVGADGKLNDQLTLGLAYSFINTDVNGKSGNKTEVDSQAFTLYGGYELGNYFVDGSLTYGFNDNDSKRHIAGTLAKADYDSDLLGLNLVGGYTWKINPQVLVEPRLAARYSLVNIDGYREKGSSAALKVEDQRYEAIELGAGVRVAGSFNLGAGTLEPQIKLMAWHDFAADQASSTSTFLLGSTPFVTSGAKAVRNSYEAGIGTDYKLGAVTLGVNYDYIGKSGFDADVFSAKVRYDF